MKEQIKGKGKVAERAQKFRVKLTRGYDFEDNSTHISCQLHPALRGYRSDRAAS